MSDLFRTAAGRWVTDTELLDKLHEVGAADCRLLYVHSEMSFGLPNPDLPRRAILESLYETLRATGVPAIVMPSFTFSFCNGVPYDRERSKSLMGALNEFARTSPHSRRSGDPLMSVVVTGDDTSAIDDLPPASLGRGSTFDRLHQRGSDVRFLFLGVNPAKCFTYIHYVEKNLDVPYRYDREFTGTVMENGEPREESWTLYVRYGGVVPGRSNRFVDFMRDERLLAETTYGDAIVSSIAEPAAYDAIAGRLRGDIDYFLDAPYPRDRQDRSFHADRMVAL